jgi:non-lysosomal glucosylceramidase
MDVVRAIRGRYDGEKRNPWNEIECGSNYARAMASYALLQTFSGFSFDLPRKKIGFAPLQADAGPFQSFWSLASGWGMYRQDNQQIELELLYGELEIEQLNLPFLQADGIAAAALDGHTLEFRQAGAAVIFPSPVKIRRSSRLVLTRA